MHTIVLFDDDDDVDDDPEKEDDFEDDTDLRSVCRISDGGVLQKIRPLLMLRNQSYERCSLLRLEQVRI